PITNVPQAQEKRTRTGKERTANQTDQLIALRHRIKTGRATAEREQFSTELEPVKLIEVDVAITKAESGEHRIIRTESSVTCDMNEALRGTFPEEHFAAGLLSYYQLGAGKCLVHRLHFRSDLRRPFIRAAHNQSALAFMSGLSPGHHVDGSARSV